MKTKIVINGSATPADALRIAYECGRARHAAGSSAWAFAVELSLRINRPYNTNPRVRFMRAGFTAGYFNYPLPDLQIGAT